MPARPEPPSSRRRATCAGSDDPKYGVFSTVDGGDWGSTTAMVVVRDTLGAIYGEPDTADSVYAVGD